MYTVIQIQGSTSGGKWNELCKTFTSGLWTADAEAAHLTMALPRKLAQQEALPLGISLIALNP